MKRLSWIGLVSLVVALLSAATLATTASAHGGRHVGGYNFVIGFLEEPAYAQLKNSIDLTICKGEECTFTVKDGVRVVSNPVLDAEKTLKAEVTMGDAAPLALPLEPRFSNPGKYVSYFVPSKPGAYTFHVFGTIEGVKIDEKFTSGIDDFSEVESIQQYPATTTNAPQGSGTSANVDVAALQQQVKEAKDSAAAANTMGIIGILAGVLGVAAAVFALMRKPAVVSPGSSTDAKDPIDSLRG